MLHNSLRGFAKLTIGWVRIRNLDPNPKKPLEYLTIKFGFSTSSTMIINKDKEFKNKEDAGSGSAHEQFIYFQKSKY